MEEEACQFFYHSCFPKGKLMGGSQHTSLGQSEFHSISVCIFATIYSKKPTSTQSDLALISQHAWNSTQLLFICNFFHSFNEPLPPEGFPRSQPSQVETATPSSFLTPTASLSQEVVSLADVLTVPKSSSQESTFYSNTYNSPKNIHFPCPRFYLFHHFFPCVGNLKFTGHEDWHK